MHVIAHLSSDPGRRVALDLVVRAVAVALAMLLILGLLPAIVETAS